MSRIGQLFRSGFVGNLGLNFGGQAIQLAIQLALVPALSVAWGLETYGTWLILFTVPGYLAMADFGLLPTAANLMAQNMARGDRRETLAVFQGLRVLVTGVIVVILAAVLGLLFLAEPTWLEFAQDDTGHNAELVVMLLTGYGLLTLQYGVTSAAYRAAHLYVETGYVYLAMIALEAIAAIALALSGHGILAVAWGYFAIRLAGTTILSAALFWKVRWLTSLRLCFGRRHLRELARPAVAAMALPAANAITFQGMVLAIGAAAGTAAVPLFTSARTLTRSALQFALIISRASMPVYTVAAARDEEEKRVKLLTLAVASCLALLLPAAVVFASFGKEIILVWTNGTITSPSALIALLAAAMVLGGIWTSLANALLATNRHGLYSYAYLAFTALSVLGAFAAVRAEGVIGAGFASLALDAIMFLWMAVLVSQLGLARRSAIRASLASLPRDLAERWRSFR